jgi:hypothetical protein
MLQAVNVGIEGISGEASKLANKSPFEGLETF